MKNDYMIRVEHDETDVTVFNFHCTRTQVEKLFFALAYASPSSSIHSASMYLVHSSIEDVDLTNRYELLNTFNCKRV